MTNDMLNKYIKLKLELFDDCIKINEFLSNMPNVLGAYCYGKNKNSYDLLFIVEDIGLWYEKNKLIASNKKQKFIEYATDKKHDFIEHLNIKQDSSFFNCTVISVSNFFADVATFNNPYIAKIVQQIFLSVKSNKNIDKLIKYSNDSSILIALLTLNKKQVVFDEVMDILDDLFEVRYGIASTSNTFQNNELLHLIYQENSYFILNMQGIAEIDLSYIKKNSFLLPTYMKNFFDKYHKYSYNDILEYVGNSMRYNEEEIMSMRRELFGVFKANLYNYNDKKKVRRKQL